MSRGGSVLTVSSELAGGGRLCSTCSAAGRNLRVRVQRDLRAAQQVPHPPLHGLWVVHLLLKLGLTELRLVRSGRILAEADQADQVVAELGFDRPGDSLLVL